MARYSCTHISSEIPLDAVLMSLLLVVRAVMCYGLRVVYLGFARWMANADDIRRKCSSYGRYELLPSESNAQQLAKPCNKSPQGSINSLATDLDVMIEGRAVCRHL